MLKYNYSFQANPPSLSCLCRMNCSVLPPAGQLQANNVMVWGLPRIRQGFAHNFHRGVGEVQSLILNRAICSKLNLLHVMLQIWQSYFLPFWSFFSSPGVKMWVTTTHFERSVCPVNLRKNVFFMPRVCSMDRWFWGFQAVVKTGGIQAPEKKCDLAKLLYLSEDEWIFSV